MKNNETTATKNERPVREVIYEETSSLDEVAVTLQHLGSALQTAGNDRIGGRLVDLATELRCSATVIRDAFGRTVVDAVRVAEQSSLNLLLTAVAASELAERRTAKDHG